MKVHKELQPLAQRAKQHGWRVELCNGGHLRFVAPDDRAFFTSATPSDMRAVNNFEAQLCREGLPRLRPEKDEPCDACRCGATDDLTFLIRGYTRSRRQAWLTRATCPKHVGKTKRDMDRAGGSCDATDWYEAASYDAAQDAIVELKKSCVTTCP